MMNHIRIVVAVVAILGLVGCASLPSGGPSAKQVQDAQSSQRLQGIQVIDVSDTVARRLLSRQKQDLFSESLKTSAQPEYVIGLGDVIEVTIWEAPPPTLFGVSSSGGTAATQSIVFPQQMVNKDGTISVPFAGKVPCANRTPQQVEKEIEQRLKDIANKPQALVRVITNNSEFVTVVGEVVNSLRMPLTSRGERLLDALAASGGMKQPVSKTMIQLTRGDRVYSLPFETVIRDPRQNIPLLAGDVITVFYQPFSFTALGDTGKNMEVDFEANGITLAQALTRVGGLSEMRSDATGVFIFRFESADALDWPSKPVTTPEGKIPVIYRVDLKDPAAFFVSQNFRVMNKDLIYVATAPLAQLERVFSVIGAAVNPALSATNSTMNIERK